MNHCQAKDCTEEITEPVMCCSGRDCGCMGMTIDPPLCKKHLGELFSGKNYNDIVGNTSEPIEIDITEILSPTVGY